MNHSKLDQSGFSLIQVMVALALLAGVSLKLEEPIRPKNYEDSSPPRSNIAPESDRTQFYL